MLSIYSTYVTSIFLEGIFFLMAGIIISSLIEVFIPQEFIEKIVPANPIAGIAVSSLTGLLFPVCECGIVPVAARLLKKGVPVSNAVTMMLSIPVVNLVVFTSTHYAFITMPDMAFYRMAGGIIVSFIIGLILYFFIDGKFILNGQAGREPQDKKDLPVPACGCGSTDHSHMHSHEYHDSDSIAVKVRALFHHSVDEFFETGKFFVTGILITSAFQTFIPRSCLEKAGNTFPLSELFMSGYAFLLSICSQTDAFIARSFSDSFSTAALLCFMISGAMIDVKTTIMLKSVFRTRFIIMLIIMIIFFTLLYSLCAEYLARGMI